MSNSTYRWVIVAAGALLGCVAIGSAFSLPVFLVPMTRETGWSRTGISTAMTIGFLAMAVGSVVWGSLTDLSELRQLLQAWRDAKASAWKAVIGWLVRGSFALLLFGIAFRLGGLANLK